MTRVDLRNSAFPLLAAFIIACCVVVGQNQRSAQGLDATLLTDAPTVPQLWRIMSS